MITADKTKIMSYLTSIGYETASISDSGGPMPGPSMTSLPDGTVERIETTTIVVTKKTVLKAAV